MQGNASLDAVRSIIQFVEDNTYNNITLEDISRHSNISMYHLHRVFKALTSKKLINYVRSRKLAHSINELLNSNLRIIDVAHEYGFDYEQSYTRSFVREYGISPDELRRKRCLIPITDKIDVNTIKPIGEDGLLFAPSIFIKPAFFITGIRHYVNNSENNRTFGLTTAANDFFYGCRQSIKNPKNPNVYIGLIEHIPQNAVYRYYTASVETTDMDNICEGMHGQHISTHKYAAFKYIGMHHPGKTTEGDLMAMHAHAIDWLRSSNYYLGDKFWFERIDTDVCREDYCEVERYFPIVERKNHPDAFGWTINTDET